ncbi:MAG: hypothetical protein UY97_C0007G0014 [Parcubacteria group bacterium GW2011_GWB1_57_6]|nr:MAG: hypothetical protein UY93_C0002G0016 [Parcubacteria group bacterium GW2011_GWA1_56_13]KKW46303.1 MAG: hypothetical protein UY97_C0007G0014 [Parcubacteria group bacterium GW2011_GWB1_57_6]
MIQFVLLCAGVTAILFFSSFHLFDSPETWMDEGLIIQSAVGLLHTGEAALPVAPGIFEPAWYITTGFPLTLPLAAAFAFFGVSLEAARLVMLAFLLCFYAVLFLYARRAIGGTAAWFGFFLLVFFAPIYGNGRNVLGEIPGLLFMLLAFLPLLYGGELTRTKVLCIGAGAGLAVATKPIFILFLPALLVTALLHRREFSLRTAFPFGALGVAVPLIVWFFLQFDGVGISQVLAIYANPHAVDIKSAIAANVHRLFAEGQPLYFFMALVAWCASYAVRRIRREAVSFAEESLLFFSVFVAFAYLRTAGYYRYFFPAQIFVLLYLPQSVLYLARGRARMVSLAVIACLCGLVLFQAYETAFRSWTAVHYNSTRTETLARYVAGLPAKAKIFVYQAPEAVPFLSGRAVYQYAEITPTIRFGEAYVPLILSGEVPRIITRADLFEAHRTDLFAHYVLSGEADGYAMLVHTALSGQSR